MEQAHSSVLGVPGYIDDWKKRREEERTEEKKSDKEREMKERGLERDGEIEYKRERKDARLRER